MVPGTDQLRLLWAVALVALPVMAGHRFARRHQTPAGAISDAILIGYFVQYLCVGVTGLLGFLSPIGVTVAAILISAAIWIRAGSISADSNESAPGLLHRRWALGICLGAVGFLAALLYSQRLQPPLATDALTYHLPAAILWLQKKRIVLFQTWFFNPANTYSPLAGSMFAAWLMAPMGNDSLARFVQLGPWVLVLFAMMNLCRNAGATAPAAALMGLAAVLSRPFISESILAKDDLFVAAFFLVAAEALTRDRTCRRFSAARFGIALGLMLATKYTAILALPVLLLAADAPFRIGWRRRQWIVAIALAAAIAGPWYLRNLIYWQNPLFPMKIDFPGVHLPGLLSSVHVQSLRSANGLWQVMTGGYFGLPPAAFILLSLIWAMALVRSARALLRDPLRRMLVLGPPVGIAAFAWLSPQAEVRFLLPVFGVMFASSSIAASGRWAFAIGAAAASIAVATSFTTDNAGQIVTFALWGLAVAMIGLPIRWLEADFFRFRRPILSGIGVGAVLLLTCVRWNRYLEEYRAATWEFGKPFIRRRQRCGISSTGMCRPRRPLRIPINS